MATMYFIRPAKLPVLKEAVFSAVYELVWLEEKTEQIIAYFRNRDDADRFVAEKQAEANRQRVADCLLGAFVP
jgi:hypothetical protein